MKSQTQRQYQQRHARQQQALARIGSLSCRRQCSHSRFHLHQFVCMVALQCARSGWPVAGLQHYQPQATQHPRKNGAPQQTAEPPVVVMPQVWKLIVSS